jgi:Zn-dependent alcohol dehydrogenase
LILGGVWAAFFRITGATETATNPEEIPAVVIAATDTPDSAATEQAAAAEATSVEETRMAGEEPEPTATKKPPPTAPARAVLAANMETAVNALWDAAPRIGDRIAVVGAGALGLLVAYLAARLPGCQVQLVDVQPARAAVAEAVGVPFALPGAARDEADLVIHASGQGEGLQTALRLAGSKTSCARNMTIACGGGRLLFKQPPKITI